jgi:hypothetical protein
MTVLRPLGALALASAFAGCLLSDLDGLSQGSGDGGGPTDSEAGPVIPEAGPAPNDAAPDAEVDAGPNLFPTPGFENGDGCGGNGYNSSFAPNPVAHSGGESCRVCSNGTASNDVFSIDVTLDDVTSPPVGTTFYAEALVRASTGVPGPDSGVSISLRTYSTPAFEAVDEAAAPYVPIDTTWKKITTQLRVVHPAVHLDVYVFGARENATCFLIDDVVVRMTPP